MTISRDSGWQESLITKPKGMKLKFRKSLKEGLTKYFSSLKLGKIKVLRLRITSTVPIQ